ncbi:MAG: orotidine-5'-phosphate decarboxylase [Fidelibacterota bacterium]|nr:MAG: orotidine-5'-phosphate decarboxylase [Candidatus Neomarinimicrobiota bacterium]
MQSPFNIRLRTEVERKQSQLCLGLDLDPARSSRIHNTTLDSLRQASLDIVEETWDQVWGYKLNFAFFERFGSHGYAWLEQLAKAINQRALVIGDAKRGDIGNSARHYAQAIFQHLNLDAATVNPYMGQDSLEPFIADPAKGAFVLCLTSNPGAEDFQRYGDAQPLHLEIAHWAQSLNDADNLGLVVGATQTEDLAFIRRAAPDLPFLVPGIGAQGGSLEAAVTSSTAEAPSIINVSRGILYAGEGSLEDILSAIQAYNQQINTIIQNHGL